MYVVLVKPGMPTIDQKYTFISYKSLHTCSACASCPTYRMNNTCVTNLDSR